MSETTRVLIVGRNHPHRGETGTLAEEILNLKDGFGKLRRVDLEEPRLGTDHCFCEAGELQPVTHSFSKDGFDA